MDKSKSVSIIGCGWLGLPLAEFLVQQGFHVRGSTTRAEKLKPLEEKGIEAFQITAGETLEDVIKKAVFDYESFGNCFLEMVKTTKKGEPKASYVHRIASAALASLLLCIRCCPISQHMMPAVRTTAKIWR